MINFLQVKREARFFKDSVEKGRNLRRLEEQTLKKRGLWEQYVEQQQKEQQRKRKRRDSDDETTSKKTAKLLGSVLG